MSRRAVWIFSTLALPAVIGGTVFALRPRPARLVQSAPVLSEPQVRDLDIAFYQRRVARDPLGARDLGQLGTLYLQRARETGSGEDLVRAEEAASLSVSHRLKRNTVALQVLAASQLAQHKFLEALESTRRLVAQDPERLSYRALLGETEMELGHYVEARTTFDSLASHWSDLSVGPRLSRWAELQGRLDEAHRLMVSARDQAVGLYGASGEQIAWFNLRVGDLALRYGRLAEAESAYRSGLNAHPGDYRLLAALARLEADRHHWVKAIQFGEQAIGIALDPATLGLVGDAYAAVGDREKAQEYFRVMEVAVLKQPGSFHRAWSLFLLDHDRDVPQVLSKAQEEIKLRKDIYGYDLLAWALHKAGQNREALAAITRARALGTQDATLLFHAGMIEHALGRRDSALADLRQALVINPSFDPFHPAVARAMVDSLLAISR